MPHIVHKSGVDMQVADVLSCRPDHMSRESVPTKGKLSTLVVEPGFLERVSRLTFLPEGGLEAWVARA